jgi:hypothetical protein
MRNENRNILHTVHRKKANLTGHILRGRKDGGSNISYGKTRKKT